MKLSLRIPIITGLLLFSTVVVNIGVLWFSLDRHAPEYISAVTNNSGQIQIDPNSLQNILAVGSLDPTTQEDYRNAISEITNISTSLESLSKNPELYLTSENVELNSTAFHIVGWSGSSLALSPLPEDTQYRKILQNIFHTLLNPLSFNGNSSEGKLIKEILQDVFIFNIIWFLLVSFLYILWIRRLFAPIHMINNRLQEFLQKPKDRVIEYHKKDEFLPLITSLNELHTSLLSQEKIRSHFLADLSHEIRTPMTAVKCMLEAIEDGIMELNPLTITTLQSEINRLVDITTRIMEYESFLSTVDPHPEKSAIPLATVTEGIILQYEAQMRKTHQKIEHHFSKKSKIIMNSDQYLQILHNIFSNFIKYAGENSTLHCRIRSEKQKVILIFEDDGVGMSSDSMALAKEKFYREDTGRNQHDGGSMGIGLSIVDRIMTIHNGSIRITKNHPHGLIISLTFPLYDLS